MAITSTANHGLEIGRRALQAQQVAINTTGHNIANANTPGYSRRRVNLESAVSGTLGGIGTGADAASIERQRNAFVDAQVLVQNQVLGKWEALETTLKGIEALFNEPAGPGPSEAGAVFDQSSGIGVSGSLSRFWNAWQDLANAPDNGAARAVVRQEGQILTSTVNSLQAQLTESRLQLDRQIRDAVAAINDLLDRVAGLNTQIAARQFDASGSGDLQDQRDRLVEQLAEHMDLSAMKREDGQVSLMVRGHDVLTGDRMVHLHVRGNAPGDAGISTVYFSDSRTPVQLRGGRLGGLLEVRDDVVPDLLRGLDDIAYTLTREVNDIHRNAYGLNGTTGIDFFAADGTTASGFALDQAILDDLDHVAVSGDGHAGDNAAALAISQLRDRRLLAGGTVTPERYYTQLLGELGTRSQAAQTMASNHRLYAQELENRRQSIQGVSLNDEAAQLVMFQHAYQAAARSVSMIDTLMQVVLNI